MKYFFFDLQRFDEITINEGGTQTLDGVTYTAINDALLNLDDSGKVSGLASGSVTAVMTGATDSPKITFDATGGAINFTATSDGKIITSKMVLPLEISSGEFNFNGSTLSISAGSEIAIVTTNGDYSLRNENTFVYDSTYTFSGAAMTSDSQRTISHFILSNGTTTRELNLEQLGKVINNFTQRGFTLVKGSSEVMNIGGYTITATAVDNDAALNIELGADGIKLIPSQNENDGALHVALSRGEQEIFAGDLQCTSGEITFGFDKAVTFAAGTSFDFKWNGYTSRVTTTATATTAIELTDKGISFTPHDGDGGLNVVLYKDGTQIFGGSLNVTGGTISFDATTQKFSFTEGTKIALAIGDGSQEMDFEITGGDASFKVEADTSGNFTITPDTGDGFLAIALKRGGETVFENTVSVNGSIIINPVTNLMTLTDGTTVSLSFNNYTLTATAEGNAASTISLTASGISITPKTDDKGKLKLTLTGTSSGSISADIEILSGGFLFGTSGTLTVVKDTELQIKFSDDYIINFKATDDAGGTISLGSDGITFAPNSDDGGLQLSITRDGVTRSASLDVTGSLTYKLDGSISLTKGTVVKNVFDDSNNILTITATTDASGSIIFNPQTGLDITPTTPDALSFLLSTESADIIKITSVKGSFNYLNRIFTASDGTEMHFVDPAGYYSDNVLRTSGGTTSLYFADYGISYTANEGATFTMDYLQGTTWELQQGTLTDNFSGPTQGKLILSEGAIFDTNDYEYPYTLGTAGNYTINGMNVTTSTENVDVLFTNYDTITFGQGLEVDIATSISGNDLDVTASATQGQGTVTVSNDGEITCDATDGTLRVSVPLEEVIGETVLSNTFDISGGTISFDPANKKISCAAGTTLTFTRDEQTITLTTTKDTSATYKVEEDIYYLMLDDSATANFVLARGGQNVIGGEMETGGVLSYRLETGTFGLTGANSSHGDGTNTFLQLTLEGQNGTYGLRAATNDTTLTFIPSYSDGKFEVNFPNERKHAMKFTFSKDGQTVFENNIAIDGKINFDTTTQEITLIKDTSLTLTQGDNVMKITALDDAGGKLSFTDAGIRFAPNTGDGALELNFVSTGRKATLDVTGAIILQSDGKISLEDGTVVDLTWTDGVNLKMTSHGSTGSIGLDAQKGIRITSDDENLDIDFTSTYGAQTTLSGIKGTIYYNAGTVSFDENSTITATTTLGGQPILTTLETIGGTGHITFLENGVNYVADTGAMKITWSKDDVESTFVVNSGSIQIGHNLFKIAEGTDLATDLKDFVPALYFTTSDAGTYTINGQTITTTGENIAMTATDDYMTFKTSDDVVTYNGMTFAGNGNVSLSPNIVALGAGVVANGFGKDKSFVLAQAGNVTADAKVFELTELETQIKIPMEITVTGAQDGFIFSRTLTKESEAYLDDALNEEDFGNYSSPYIGKVFSEKFIAEGDSSYRIRTDAIGLEEVIGISDDTTVTGGASLADEPTLSYYKLITETEGNFTIGEKTYNISGDSSVAITARFDADGSSYASAFDSLNGTVSGDFNDGNFSVNGGESILISGGSSIDIIADDNGSNVTINAGAGENLITLTDDATGNNIVLKGKTTVEGFKTGFGEGSDSVYVEGDAPAVDFKEEGLKLYYDNDADNYLTFAGLSTTAGLNIYYEQEDRGVTEVFIADDEWYKVAYGAADYYVGATAKMNHGIDFGGISDALNISLNTDYEADVSFWVNNIHSIKGGDGLTTITGSDKSDTIIAGEGETTINAAAGDDVIQLGIRNEELGIDSEVSNVLIQYNVGDGNDYIAGFNANSTLSIDGTYSTQTSGNDVIVSVGDEEITLEGAANLDTRNIKGKLYVSPEQIEERIGVNPVATYSDEDFTNGTLDLTKSEGSQEVSLASGNQTLKLNDDGGNVAVVEDGSGTKTIALGNGGDAVITYANKGKGSSVNVTGGTGNDTLYTFGNAPVTFDMKNGGKDKISSRFNGENIILKNYKASLGGGIATGDTSTQSIVDEVIDAGNITFGDNEIKLEKDNGTSAKFTFADNATGYNIFNMYATNGEAQAIGFTNKDGGKLDVSKEKEDYILVGNYFDGKKESSTITGGAGNDTLLGGEGDVLNAGGGNANLIILADDDNREGADIILSDGKTTVENFKAGFDDDNDRVFFGVDDVVDFKFDGTNVSVETNDAWRGVLSEVSDGADFANILIADATGFAKVAVAQENAVIAVEDELADIYYGKNSAINFTNYDGELMANIASEANSIGADEIIFSGINQITAGGGQTTLMGSARNETLYAGTGTASLYGGGGRNLLANSSEEKDGATTFVVLGNANGARNTIQGFNFVTEDGVADKIEIDTATNVVSDVRINGSDVVIEVTSRKGTATERAVIQGAVGQDMKFGDNVIAQVNTTALTYDGTANYFVATEKNAAISVGADVGNKAEIWLGNENFVGDIRTIDATASSVKAELAGNDADNVISAGSGDSSLWGGIGGDDFMQGGSGKNAFFYTKGNGDDTIGGANAGDVVYLSEMTLDQIASTGVTNNVATINFKDGGKLTIDDASNCNFVMTQGDQSQIYKVSGNNFIAG